MRLSEVPRHIIEESGMSRAEIRAVVREGPVQLVRDEWGQPLYLVAGEAILQDDERITICPMAEKHIVAARDNAIAQRLARRGNVYFFEELDEGSVQLPMPDKDWDSPVTVTNQGYRRFTVHGHDGTTVVSVLGPNETVLVAFEDGVWKEKRRTTYEDSNSLYERDEAYTIYNPTDATLQP